MKIDITYTMNKTGKIRDPFVVIFLTVITCGIYGLIWFGRIAQELKDYRIKGAPGWFLIMGLFVPMVNFACFVAAIYYLFEIPRAVGRERIKIDLPRGISGLAGLLPFIALIFLAAIYVLWFHAELSYGYYIIGYCVLVVMAVSQVLVWMFKVQKNINELWYYAEKNRELSAQEVDKSNLNSDGTMEIDKDV